MGRKEKTCVTIFWRLRETSIKGGKVLPQWKVPPRQHPKDTVSKDRLWLRARKVLGAQLSNCSTYTTKGRPWCFLSQTPEQNGRDQYMSISPLKQSRPPCPTKNTTGEGTVVIKPPKKTWVFEGPTLQTSCSGQVLRNTWGPDPMPR